MTSPPLPDAPPPRLPWRRFLLLGLLFVALTAAGLYAVYDRFAGKTVDFDQRLLHPLTLLAVVGLLTVYFLSDALRLHFTLRALGRSLPFRCLMRLVFINLFVSNVTPMATGGGVAQIWYMQRQGVPIGSASAATTIRTVLAILFIFSLTPVFLMTLNVLDHQPLAGDISLALAVFIALYLAFFAVVLWRSHWLIAPLSGALALLHRYRLVGEVRHRRWQYRIRREMLRFSHSFGVYLRGPRRFVWLSVFFTALFLLSLFSFPALLIASLGYDVDYITSTGLLVVTTFIMYFSPTPGASGISEGVFGTFFQGIVGASHLVLVILAWRFLTIYLGMMVGLVVMQREFMRSGTRE